MARRRQSKNLPPAAGKSPARRTGIFKRIVFAILPAVLLLVFVEVALRLAGFQFSAWFIEFPVFVASEDPARVRTASMFTDDVPYGYPFCVDQTFTRKKEPDTLRIVLLGESSIMRLGKAPLLEELLEQQLRQPIEILNFGFQGCGSERILLCAREALAYEPDVLLVYTGHNEFVSGSNPATMTEATGANAWADRALHARTVQLAAKLLYTYFPPPRASLEGRERLYRDEEKESFYAAFERNLEQIVTLARQRGVPVLLGTVAYNYMFPPTHVIEPGAEFDEVIDMLAETSANDVAARFPHDPIAEYAIGRFEVSRGNALQAREWIDRSFLHDARPHRADARINAIIRRVAERNDAPLVDVHAAIIAAAPNGVPGIELLSDNCHLNDAGNQILLASFAAAIAERLPTKAATEKH